MKIDTIMLAAAILTAVAVVIVPVSIIFAP